MTLKAFTLLAALAWLPGCFGNQEHTCTMGYLSGMGTNGTYVFRNWEGGDVLHVYNIPDGGLKQEHINQALDEARLVGCYKVKTSAGYIRKQL